MSEPKLNSQQLADRLGRHVSYIRAMRRRGFRGVSLKSALRWLAVPENEFPRKARVKGAVD